MICISATDEPEKNSMKTNVLFKAIYTDIIYIVIKKDCRKTVLEYNI